MDKKTISKLVKKIAILSIALLLAMTASTLVRGGKFVYVCLAPEGTRAEEVVCRTDTDGIVEITKVRVWGDSIYVNMRAVGNGSCVLSVFPKEGYEITSVLSAVRHLYVQNTENMSFSGATGHVLMLIFYFAILIALLLKTAWSWTKTHYYSYSAVYLFGVSAYLLVMSVMEIIFCVRALLCPALFGYRQVLEQIMLSGSYFVIAATPFVLAFSILLIVSNIVFIRKEGFGRLNIVGLGLSAVLIAAETAGFLLVSANISGSEAAVRNHEIFSSTFTAFLSFTEFLMGAMILCCFIAGRHNPKDGRDYVIIPGCSLRKNGEPTPLLRGRIERAMRYNRDICEKAGAGCVFVPSGGQGADEVISESESMKRYLMEHGISEGQIMKEDRSTDTAENMRYSAKLIAEKSENAQIAFATSSYHVFRTGLLAEQAGIHAEGMGSRTKWYYWPDAFVREMIGLLSYRKRGLTVAAILFTTAFAVVSALMR